MSKITINKLQTNSYDTYSLGYRNEENERKNKNFKFNN